MLNEVTLIGRLGKEPEMSKTKQGVPVCTTSICVDRDVSPQAEKQLNDWFQIVLYKSNAEFLCNYFHKGDSVIIRGRLQSRRYEDIHGNDRTAIEINVDKVYNPIPKKLMDAARAGRGNSSGFKESDDESELPF